MKLRILLLAIVAFALSASPALAHDNGKVKHDEAHAKAEQAKQKGNKHHDCDVCRPVVGVKLRGEITEIDEGGFWMIVKKANRHGKRFIAEDPTADGAAVYIAVDEKTKLRRTGEGKIQLTDLLVGDNVKVKTRACKRELRDTETTPELHAKHVKAKKAPAETAEDEQKADDDTDDNSDDTGENTNDDTGENTAS